MVKLRSRQAVQMSPDVVVYIVDNREDTPKTVDLRVVAVEFGYYEDDGSEDQGKRQAHHQRVGREIDVQQCLAIVDALHDPER